MPKMEREAKFRCIYSVYWPTNAFCCLIEYLQLLRRPHATHNGPVVGEGRLCLGTGYAVHRVGRRLGLDGRHLKGVRHGGTRRAEAETASVCITIITRYTRGVFSG